MHAALIIYAAGVSLLALRLGWHMYSKLDNYDWAHTSIWWRFSWLIAFWPLAILIYPDSIIATHKFFRSEEASVKRELDKFLKNPPPCGSLFRFSQKEVSCDRGNYETDPPCYGEFIMSSPDVEVAYRQWRGKNNRSSFCGIDLENEFLIWLSRRDATLREASELPALFSDAGYSFFSLGGLKQVTRDLAVSGHATVWCSKCATIFSGSQIARRWEYVNQGSSQCDRLYCPQNHVLLSEAHYTGGIRRRKS